MEVREVVQEGTGKILQTKIFMAYSSEITWDRKKEYYYNSEDEITLNDFIQKNSEKVHAIIPMAVGDYGRVLVFYYEILGDLEKEEKK